IEDMDEESLRNFINSNKINFIIDQGVVKVNRVILRRVSNSENSKIISVIHSKPDLIKVTPSYKSLRWDFKKFGIAKKIIVLLKILFFPIYKKASNLKYIKWKRDIYDNSDKVVVLSNYYIDNFVNLLHLKNTLKITSIGNPLRFNSFFDKEKLNEKQNEVLIVSRLSEPDKYLSRIFDVWRIIEQDHRTDNWRLTIVGGGSDEPYYKARVESLKLKNIRFEGVQNPFDYYNRAKIFFMSSAHEGFPMTLLEAQQMGVPVIAFNNFESLQELVIDGYNGFVVGPKDINSFVQRTRKLMLNDELRITYAKNAIDHSKNYTIDKILDKWENLFNELINEEKK
ncbi:MAG: glycosyltransferase, partial [Acholeplasma sp.]|nr:glycosyltransferase [Acholeplasma sp.]